MDNSILDAAGWYLDEYDGERFWSLVNFRGGTQHEADPLATAQGECWRWGAPDSLDDAYGRFVLYGKYQQAHRIAYKDFGHKLTDDLYLDHLCRNMRCVNPRHLEPVTQQINVDRGLRGRENVTHCPSGHEYTDDNTSWLKRRGNSVRYCTTCLKVSRHRSYQRRKDAGKV